MLNNVPCKRNSKIIAQSSFGDPCGHFCRGCIVQRAAVDTLIGRTLKAAKAEGLERVVVAGGVGANKLLRQEMAQQFDGGVHYPRMEFCTDNGAMIAGIAYHYHRAGKGSGLDLNAAPRVPAFRKRYP